MYVESNPEEFREMMDAIANRVDLATSVLLGGAAARWRRSAALATQLRLGDRALDVACGPGQLAAELARLVGPDGRITGADFSAGMIRCAQDKYRNRPELTWTQCNALELPFQDETFDAVTISFALRYLSDQRKGLASMRRVLRKGGQLVILDVNGSPSEKAGPLRRIYLKAIVPLIGGIITGRYDVYRRLGETVEASPRAEHLARMAQDVGFRDLEIRNLLPGSAILITARRDDSV